MTEEKDINPSDDFYLNIRDKRFRIKPDEDTKVGTLAMNPEDLKELLNG